jgi:NADH-quinone oxidoreductase subunit F
MKRQTAEPRGAFPTNSQPGQMLPADRGLDATKRTILDDLREIQREFGVVGLEDVRRVADENRVPPAVAYGVASFYSMIVLDHYPAEFCAADPRHVIRVCDGPVCCLRDGLTACLEVERWARGREDVAVTRTSCIGLCDMAPALSIDESAIGWESLSQIPAAFDSLFRPNANGSVPVPESTSLGQFSDVRTSDGTTSDATTGGSITGLPLTSRWGNQSTSLLDYSALACAVANGKDEILRQVEQAGLRGRGGAGYPTGRKWRSVAEASATQKFVVCNADESEPGVFKDRAIMENDPHLLLEGMLICGLAIGAKEGIIYIRGEYQRAEGILRTAIAAAYAHGVLGKSVRGADHPFDIRIHCGAGAYICGEESALLESLEGKRGEPRSRPPYPTVAGLNQMPTVVNNVETLAAVPYIIQHGGENYCSLGRGSAAGTKIYCVSGNVRRPLALELPMGATARELIYDHAEGLVDDRPFKCAVSGGAAGTFMNESMLDIPLDFDAWDRGVSLGSGSLIVADDRFNVVTLLLWILKFFEHESCGKCTPCRVGTRQLRQMVQRIESGRGANGDVERLLALSKLVERTSFCGLGQSVSLPVESAVRCFPTDFNTLGAF